ncbi:hypothetical protein PtB15_7B162 [Puccinia triticina]|nr:hypothetical protein PtB15_7B162 [Puccinia triticina]
MTISSQQCSSSSPVDLLTNLHDATINPQPSVQTSAVRDGSPTTHNRHRSSNCHTLHLQLEPYQPRHKTPLESTRTLDTTPVARTLQHPTPSHGSCELLSPRLRLHLYPNGPYAYSLSQGVRPCARRAKPTTSPPDHEALGPAPPAARSPTNATSPASSSNQFMNHRHQQPRLQPARITQLGPNNLLHLLLARY